MPARAIRRPANLPAELRQLVDAIDQALQDNLGVLMEGHLTDEYIFGAPGTINIKHSLPRDLRGWFPVRVRAGSAVSLFEDTTATKVPAGHVAIGASGVCRARFWVW